MKPAEMLNRPIRRAKSTAKGNVPLFLCPEEKVPLFGTESGELRSEGQETPKNQTHQPFSTKCIQDTGAVQVPPVPLFFTPEQLAKLAGVSPRAVRKVITEGRLRADVSKADAGHHKGRPVNLIAHDDAFAFYPRARTTWSAQQVIKAKLAEAEADNASTVIKPPSGINPIPDMKDWQRRRMDARLGLLRYVEGLVADAGLTRERAVNRLVADADAARLPEEIQQLLPIANARSGQSGDRTLSRRTLQRWAAEAKQGMDHLAPRAYERPMPSWLPLLLTLYRQPQKPSLSFCVQELGALIPEGQKAPSYDAARRALDKVGAVEREKGRMLPRELKTIKPFRRREKPEFPMDVLTMDGHTFDAEIAHPEHGRPFRPELTVTVDVATGKALGWSAWEKENTWSVMDALRMAIVAGGTTPLILYTDNGPGYRNARMQQLEARIGFKHHFSIPYNSQARGVVERLQKTLWIDLGAKAFQTYVGAAMDREARQIVYKAGRRGVPVLPSWRTFVSFMEQAVAVYNARPSRGCPKALNAETGRMQHLSPAAAWARAESLGWKPEGPAVSLTDFRPQELRQVDRGEIRLFGNYYFNKELAELHGEKVLVMFDIHDANQVWVHRQDGTFVCEAGFEANKSDYFSIPYVETLRDQRRDGQRKRLEAKQERVLGEPLEPTSIRELTPQALAASEAQMRKLGVFEPDQEDVVEASLPSENESHRPAFRNDQEYANWVLDHPDQADPEETREINDRLKKDKFFRMLLGRDDQRTEQLA